MSYLLDANVFIQAKNLHYGLDFCPAFWEWLVAENAAGRVFTIDKVADEIAAGDDELTEWMKSDGAVLVRPTDAGVASKFGELSTWARSQRYEATAIHTFLQVADYYLIAHAMAGGHAVVTHEVPSDTTKRIKIPNVCAALGLRFTTPYQMLRVERARFVLGPAA